LQESGSADIPADVVQGITQGEPKAQGVLDTQKRILRMENLYANRHRHVDSSHMEKRIKNRKIFLEKKRARISQDSSPVNISSLSFLVVKPEGFVHVVEHFDVV
jgi:hypothetical protein